jgi:hypothetical protein
MKLLLCLLLIGAISASLSMSSATEEKGATGAKIVHDVYFTLKDNSPEARKKLVDACKKYLTKHTGEEYFAVGTLAEDLKRDVNDRDWDVGLHIVFANQAAHDKYQDADRHNQFIAECKENWKKVRVFDTATAE